MFPAQRHFFAWAENCQESNPGLLWNFQQPWPTSQTLRWKNSIFYGYKTIVFCRKVNFHFPMVEIPGPSIFFLPKPKVSIYSVSVYSCSPLCSVWWSTANNWGKANPQIQTCFWARHRNKISEGNCDFLSTKCFINVYLSWWSLINRLCCWKLETSSYAPGSLDLHKESGDQLSKNWENLDFSWDSARILVF